MLILQGTLRAVAQIGGGTDRKTGEVYPIRDVLQIEEIDHRGLVQMRTIYVEDNKPWADKKDKVVNLPVRAYVGKSGIDFAYQQPQQVAA